MAIQPSGLPNQAPPSQHPPRQCILNSRLPTVGAAPQTGGHLHPDLEKLIALQRLDLELGKLREDLAAVPSRIAALAAKSAEGQAARITLEDSLAKEEKLRRSQESDIKAHQERITRLRKQMDVVTTSAQAAALDHEIAFITTEITRIEDTELDSMARSEFFEQQLPKARETLSAAQANLERERTRGADHTAATQTRIDALSTERNALRPTISESALNTYDRISKSRGTALSEGMNGKCSACQMMIRTQIWQDLRDRSRHDLMLTCDTCGRLLFYDPARDAPQKKPADREESIAARIVRSL
jgi:predicted  nucleic acid-binding Zn-ribbon protein